MAQSGKPSFLPDRFDDVERDLRYVGIHRRQQSSWSMFAPVGIGLGTVVVLVLAGMWLLDRSDDYRVLDTSDIPLISGDAPPEDGPIVLEPELPEEVVAITDPSQIDTEGLTLTVLNGTTSQGMAARAATRLVAKGWPEALATNADSSTIQQSLVVYASEEDEAIALGIALVLDIDPGSVIQDTRYPGVRVTVVLGSDYGDSEST